MVDHVALVTSWPTRWCGIASYSVDLAKALGKAGIRCSIVSHLDSARREETTYSCAGPREDPSEPEEPVHVAGVHHLIDQRDPSWPDVVLEGVRKLNPSVVHVQHEFGLFSRLKKGGSYGFLPEEALGIFAPMFGWNTSRIPVVATLHSVFRALTYDETLYYEQITSLAHAVIVHEAYQEQALEDMIGRPLENVFHCPHGTWPDQIHPSVRSHLRKRWMCDRGSVVAGMIGWWEPNKGFERVVKMWPRILERHPSAVLVIAGDARPGSPTGPAYKERLLRMVDASPARSSVRIETGRFSEAEYHAIIGSFDFAILPYLYASQSGNLAHAYGAGVPTVASAIEGLASSIEASRAGLLAADDQALEECVARMASSPDLRRDLAQRAWDYASHVASWENVAKAHVRIYSWAAERAKDRSRYQRFAKERVHV